MSRREPAARARAWSAVAAATLVATLGIRAGAEVLDASSTTLVDGRADPRDGVVRTAVPAYELVSVRASGLRVPGVDDMNVVISGWGAIELADREEGKRGLGDLDVAFAEGKLLHRRVVVRLGRQLLMSGAGRNLAFDGLAVTAMPLRWAGVSAQGGVPVTPRFAASRGDALVAGRLFVRPAFGTEAGLSFLQVLDHGEIARRDLALDARFVPSQAWPVWLTGFALVSLPDERLGEANVSASAQLGLRLEVTGEYRRTAPDIFLPRNSIFSVFSQESHDEAGGFVYLRIVPRLRLQADYHVIVDGDGTGQDATAKLTGTLCEGRATLGAESRRLDLPSGSTAAYATGASPGLATGASGASGYTTARAFGVVRLTPVVIATADAAIYFFAGDVNGERRSYNAAATLAWSFHPRWRAVLTGIGSVTPFAEERFEGMAKLVYQLSTEVRRVVAVTP
jgi:hypothetical protein